MSNHPNPVVPPAVQAHSDGFFPDAWKEYTITELGNFIHLMVTRSLHRGSPERRAKDLYHARLFWQMMGAHLRAHELDAGTSAFSFKPTKPELVADEEREPVLEDFLDDVFGPVVALAEVGGVIDLQEFTAAKASKGVEDK